MFYSKRTKKADFTSFSFNSTYENIIDLINQLDICEYRKGKVNISNLTLKTYISTENMLPDKAGVVEANSLPSIALVQEYKEDDTLVSNIRPYFKKVWQAKYDGGCSNDVLVFQGSLNVDKDFLYYILANDDFFAYSMATSAKRG